MATLGSKLVTKQMEWRANMTEQKHLGAALLAKPHKMIGTMDKLFSSENYYSDNPISSMLMGNKKTEETISSTEWEWELKGANTRPLVVIENVMPESFTTLGKFRETFKIKLDENWFLPGDIISPGASNKRYQCRIQDEVVRQGNGWVYTVRIMSDDPQMFIPVEYLSAGTQWAKLFAQYTEADHQSGSTQYSMPLALRNKMGKYRKQYKITDYALQEVLAVKIPDSKGTYHDSWMRFAEVEYWQQWYRELERGYWYSRSTETVMGANGRTVRSGPGVQEMLEDSHVQRYTHLTAKLIEEYLMDIFYSRKKPGKTRQIKAYTGEYGMALFHGAIQDWIEKSGFVKNVEVYTDKVKSDYHTNALSAGIQYTSYKMSNGATLELIHNPLYDDREINLEIDPISGKPVESQRFTFLDFSGESNTSNLKLMNKKDGFACTYIEGMVGPYGAKKPGSTSAHSGSYYEMHCEKSCGLHINDITKCGELILTRN